MLPGKKKKLTSKCCFYVFCFANSVKNVYKNVSYKRNSKHFVERGYLGVRAPPKIVGKNFTSVYGNFFWIKGL